MQEVERCRHDRVSSGSAIWAAHGRQSGQGRAPGLGFDLSAGLVPGSRRERGGDRRRAWARRSARRRWRSPCCRPASTSCRCRAEAVAGGPARDPAHRLLHDRCRQRPRGACAWRPSADCPSLDAPVSGGVAGAAAATLTFMVGGSREAFAEAEPILAVMGKRVVHCGEAGAGQAAKICNNMILGISMIARRRGLRAGREARPVAPGRCSTSPRPRPASAGR